MDDNSQPAGDNPKEEPINPTHNGVSENTWIKLTGPSAESLARAFFGTALVVLQENKGGKRGAEEDDEAKTQITSGREAGGGGVDATGRESTARVTTLPAAPTRIVLAGEAQAEKSIKVLNAYRIVLLGFTKSGKSSLANTIFGEDVFKIDHTALCGTSACQAESRSVDGRRITVVDTPGFLDFSSAEEQLRREKWISDCAPGPRAFFIVVKVEECTEQVQDAVTEILQRFSEEALKYAAVVFTHGDLLPEGMKIKEFIDQNKYLRDLVGKCGGRCHVVDNKYWKNNQQGDYRSNKFQVAELLSTTDKMVMENKGGCYMDKIEEEGRRTSVESMSQGNTSSKAKKNVWIKLTGPAAISLAEAFFGLAVADLPESGVEDEQEGEDNEDIADEDAPTEDKEDTEPESDKESEEEAPTEADKEEVEEEERKQGKKQKEKQQQKPKNKAESGRQSGRSGGGFSSLFGFLFGFGASLFGALLGLGASLFGPLLGLGASLFGPLPGLGASLFGPLLGSGLGAPSVPGPATNPGGPANPAGPADPPGSASPAGAPDPASTTGVAAKVLKALKAASALVVGGGVLWVAQKMYQLYKLLKSALEHIRVILPVVVFFAMLLLSFGLQVRMFGTILLWFGVIFLFLLLMVLFMVL